MDEFEQYLADRVAVMVAEPAAAQALAGMEPADREWSLAYMRIQAAGAMLNDDTLPPEWRSRGAAIELAYAFSDEDATVHTFR